jgi:hypothetical protein
MSDHDPTDPYAEFAERAGRALRSPERLNDTFEDRLMHDVRAIGPISAKPAPLRSALRWMVQPRSFRLSPMAGLAVAAGFAGIVAAASLRWVRPETPRVGVPAATIGDTPNIVARAAEGTQTRIIQFVVTAPRASRVTLVGDFNDWDAAAAPLTRVAPGGVWTISIPLVPGRHEYAFLVDGTRWITDPASPNAVGDDFGTPNSVITVGERQI